MHFYRGSGTGAARYFDEGHQGAESYYTEASRSGAARVAVEIDTWAAGERSGPTVQAGPGDLIRWVEGIDLATGEMKGLIRSGGKDRQPLRFVEVVVNNPKSLSIVASQNPTVAAAVDRVLTRQADEISAYLSSVAVTRTGPRGGQVEVGGLSVETARVRHLTSREGDPHRHVHLMVNTRVRTPDGEWHGLHSAAVRQHIRAVNERGTRILLTDRGLREVLASEGYSLGVDGEIDQARSAVQLMSKRAVQVAANRDRAETVWRGAHPGREPSQRVRNGWDQAGWAEGRKAKPYERETPEDMAERVRVELAEVGLDFTPGARTRLVEQERVVSVGQMDRDRVAGEAVAVLSSMRSAWSDADLTAGVEARVSASGLVGDPRAVAELVDDVRARSAGRCVSVLDPGVHTPTAMSRHLSSPQVLDADMALNLGLAGLAGGTTDRDVGLGVSAAAAGLVGLDSGQGAAVAAVCGPRRLEVVIGPAGTGKTRMLAVAKTGLDGQGRQLRVVAPTRKGAQVAAAEIGVEGAALSKLLHEHGWRWDSLGRWKRLDVGQVDPATGRTYEGPDLGWALTGRSVVIVDEAGLMTVDQANALIDLAAESGAAVRLVGDPRQLGAVGRGGVMEIASRWVDGGAVALDQVHRFLTVTPDADGLPVTGPDIDYANLSLLLRDGGQPEVAAGRLADRGAVVVHASQAGAVAAIAAQVVAASQGEAGGLAVTVATNEQADQINQAVRTLRVAAGQVDDTRTVTAMDGVAVGVGDRIVTRRNNTAADVANREIWTVEKITGDGTIVARSLGSTPGRQVRLEPAYVAAAVQLAYASTDYGNQGITVDRSVTWVSEATTAGGLYVGVTRGRYDNTLHVVADDLDDARAQLAAAAGRDRADRGLDAARSLAETDAILLPAPPPNVDAAPPAERLAKKVRVDPGGWRTETELRTAGQAVEARLAERLPGLVDVEVMPDEVRERANRADRDPTSTALSRHNAAMAQTARIQADRYRIAAQAVAEYLTARDDARIIDAGPGHLGRKTSQVETAVARRDETARRWSEPDLPQAAWTDQEVHTAAQGAAERAVATTVASWQAEASRHTDTVDALKAQVTARNHNRQTAITTNQANTRERQALLADAEQARAQLAAQREARTVQAATMTPDQIADADRARSAYLAEQGRLHQILPARTLDAPAGEMGELPGRAGLDPATLDPATFGRPRFDPAEWRTAGELARDAETVEATVAAGLRLLPSPMPVMADDQWEREDQADRAAATDARERAAQARGEAARIEAGQDDLIDKATAEFFAGRDAARMVEAGPGRFARKNGLVENARARWAETAQTWSPHPFPAAGWDDETVRQAASTAATETVIVAARPYQETAEREERTAAGHEHRIAVRDHDQQQARETNQRIVEQHQALHDATDAGRAAIAGHWEVRAGRVEALTPEQLAAADHIREIYTAEQTRRRELIAQREQALQAARQQQQQRALEIDHGFGIEM